MRFRGRVAIVTGAGHGLGAEYSRALAAAGASVTVADLDLGAARSVARSITDGGGTAIAVNVDVADETSVDAMVAQTIGTFGRLDVLVNNAAVMFRGLDRPRTPFWETEAATWDLVLAVNVKGSWLCAKAAFPHLRESGHGRIVNISSNMALGTDLIWPAGMSPYTTSKAAVIGLTRALAGEAGAYGVTVNAVAPGVTATETVREHIDAERLEAMAAAQSLPRVAEPIDIVGTVLFLCSDDAAFVTGQTIVVDGGLMT